MDEVYRRDMPELGQPHPRATRATGAHPAADGPGDERSDSQSTAAGAAQSACAAVVTCLKPGRGQQLGDEVRPHAEPNSDRWAKLATDAADEVGLPDHPEFRPAFVNVPKCGTRPGYPTVLALHNSAVRTWFPHRGWRVAQPYRR